MHSRLLRIIGAMILAITGIGAFIATPTTQAAVGDSVFTAESLATRNVTKVAAIKEMSDYWFYIRRPGGGRGLSMTLQVAPADDLTVARANMFVVVRFDPSRHEQFKTTSFGKHAAGTVELGFLTRTPTDSGADRKYYKNTGAPEDYFLRLKNDNPYPVSYAFTVEIAGVDVNSFWQLHPKEFAPLPQASSLLR